MTDHGYRQGLIGTKYWLSVAEPTAAEELIAEIAADAGQAAGGHKYLGLRAPT